MPRNTVTKKANTSKQEKQENDEEANRQKRDENLDDKQAAMFRSGVRKQSLFLNKLPPKWMRNETTLVDYCEKQLELQSKSVSAYSQASTKPKDYRASVLFTAANAKFLRCVVCMVVTLSKLILLSIKPNSGTSCNG